MTVDVMNLIDREVERRAQPRQSGSKKPLFLFFKEGHRALVRPLYNLPQAIVLNKHNKWTPDKESRVNAICAQEEGKPCFYCAKAVQDKKLNVSSVLYLPVYVYGVRDAQGNALTYEEKGENDTKTTQNIKGMRVLELTLSGSMFDILSQFRDIVKDDAYKHTIMGCDFTITQIGAGTEKKFTTTPKPPSEMHHALPALIPEVSNLRELILDALQPVITADGVAEAHYNATGKNMTIPTDEDSVNDVPNF